MVKESSKLVTVLMFAVALAAAFAKAKWGTDYGFSGGR